MLTPPDLTNDTLIALARDRFGLYAVDITFLPIGADINSAVYRLVAEDGTPFFLKLRRANFSEVVVAVPAALHAAGIRRVMAPLATPDGRLWAWAEGFHWILYPFFEGRNGYEVALSRAQWNMLGESFRAIHTTRLPDDLARRVPRETYAPRWREVVRAHDAEILSRAYDDPVAAELRAFWLARRDEIRLIVDRADALARDLRQRKPAPVLCHADLHGANVLVDDADGLTIVDWDEVSLAPRERDLMSIGGGLFGDWPEADEATWFYEGYGPVAIDRVALAYYRYERIVADIAAYAEQIFGLHGSAEDRRQGLRELTDQFLPDRVIALAHRTYTW